MADLSAPSTSGDGNEARVEKCAGCHYTIAEFRKNVLSSVDNYVPFLVQHGCLLHKVQCISCGRDVPLNKEQLHFRCSKPLATTTERASKKNKKFKYDHCTFRMSARKGTFFENSKLSVQVIMEFVLLWLTERHPRHDFIRAQLRLGNAAVVDWSNFCREICFRWASEASEVLGGPGKTVEIDEAKFGKRKYNRGRRILGQWVFGGIERESRKVFLIPVDRRDKTTLLGIIKSWIHPSSTVVSDCWKAYDCLQDEGFNHLVVNHSLHFVDPETGAHTNTIERVWREVRGAVPRSGRYGVHFEGYLAEYLFKRAYPDLTERIHAFWSAVCSVYPPTSPPRLP